METEFASEGKLKASDAIDVIWLEDKFTSTSQYILHQKLIENNNNHEILENFYLI